MKCSQQRVVEINLKILSARVAAIAPLCGRESNDVSLVRLKARDRLRDDRGVSTLQECRLATFGRDGQTSGEPAAIARDPSTPDKAPRTTCRTILKSAITHGRTLEAIVWH